MTPDSSRPVISRVEVVMPVHDKEQHLGPALAALRAAAETLVQQRPSAAVGITVVLDRCTDRSPEIAASFAESTAGLNTGVPVLRRRFRNAGASRAAGAATGLLDADNFESTWLANTDADSRVPADWLVRQLGLADAGWDVVLGSVEPDSAGVDPELLRGQCLG